ncbi:MAG TPA: hypothetical protein VME70_03725 [Mycobacteriales bacterium]|nr:hypothetical protein [Mycobacteriales bacterium]
MTTDEQIRDAFHARFGTELADLAVDPALVAVVRRRYARQQRLVLLGAPLGVAALAAGSILAANAVGSGAVSGINGLTSNAAQSGVSVTLLNHRLQFPAGWSGSAGTVMNLGPATHHLGGKDQGAKLMDRSARMSLGMSMFRGPIATAERAVVPAAERKRITTTIAGLPAVIDQFGTSPVCPMSVVHAPAAATVKRLISHTPLPMRSALLKSLRTARFSKLSPAGFGVGVPQPGCARATKSAAALPDHVSTAITFPDGDLLMVDSIGMSPTQVEHVLADAISS